MRTFTHSILIGVLIAKQILYNGQKINGVTVTFVEVNGEKEEGTLQSFESDHSVSITGFPTIFLVKGNSVIEFDSDITQDNLTNFLNLDFSSLEII